jgi:hypothetical protein
MFKLGKSILSTDTVGFKGSVESGIRKQREIKGGPCSNQERAYY